MNCKLPCGLNNLLAEITCSSLLRSTIFGNGSPIEFAERTHRHHCIPEFATHSSAPGRRMASRRCCLRTQSRTQTAG